MQSTSSTPTPQGNPIGDEGANSLALVSHTIERQLNKPGHTYGFGDSAVSYEEHGKRV